jgi:hypothetical protein
VMDRARTSDAADGQSSRDQGEVHWAVTILF